MRRILVLVLAISVPLSVLAMAQPEKGSTMGDKDKPATSAPLKTIRGTVKSEGEKTTFVSDKDKKSWDVMNPEVLKGHEGHHVQLKAHVYLTRPRFTSWKSR